ncbi:MAG: ArsC family reductase [Spongiibacteraceae bacterium]
MSTVLYGIKNCDTVRAARRWLDEQQIEYHFQDVREMPLSRPQIEQWIAELGHQKLVNKRSTSWKQLSEQQRQQLDASSAVDLLLATPTLMKRPLLDTGRARHLGFSAEDYRSLFTHHTL